MLGHEVPFRPKHLQVLIGHRVGFTQEPTVSSYAVVSGLLFRERAKSKACGDRASESGSDAPETSARAHDTLSVGILRLPRRA
jgi:hypothetical protein